MEVEEKELEVEVAPVVTDEYITKDNYKEFLKSMGNPFAMVDDDFFTKNTIKRLKGLNSPAINRKNNITSILQYLAVLCMVDRKIPTKFWDDVKSNTTSTMNRMQIRSRSVYPLPDPKIYNPMYCYLNINVAILPYCCGVCEYGNFVFDNEIDTISLTIKYNMIMDLIRLHAICYRIDTTGAYNIINYFVNEAFTKVLESREDLTFIKEFTNPKTKKTLKSFMFNTVI